MSKPICPDCGSMAWRVRGLRCSCGLRRGTEDPLQIVDFIGVRNDPIYPEGAPRFGRSEIATVTRKLNDLNHHQYVRRARMTGDVTNQTSNVVNPFFKDEIGNHYGTLVVISRAENLAAQARWRLRCSECGGLQTLSGHSIRRAQKLKQGPLCPYCVEQARKTGERA